PAGDVTRSRRTAGWSSPSRTILAAPSTVCAASVKATGRGSPAATPPSESASMTVKTYAGPLPERPVTASMSDSSTLTAVPTEEKIRMATSRCSSVADAPLAMAEAAALTTQAMFGITLITGAPLARWDSMALVDTPAMIEMTSLSLVYTELIDRSASGA